jgi:hypothetical protein
MLAASVGEQAVCFARPALEEERTSSQDERALRARIQLGDPTRFLLHAAYASGTFGSAARTVRNVARQLGEPFVGTSEMWRDEARIPPERFVEQLLSHRLLCGLAKTNRKLAEHRPAGQSVRRYAGQSVVLGDAHCKVRDFTRKVGLSFDRHPKAQQGLIARPALRQHLGEQQVRATVSGIAFDGTADPRQRVLAHPMSGDPS